ncbi:hypothetical protein BDV41DRAFT_577500 [Aspergillus transmontanensis]|uniref:Uncharacterized protein n=1 Tax=Aspergillus transmontanensis TaxID=1034304 RepID=A0A5N6VV96_9EURO|nr:hypothetical protein BDV41DRAFT_577500 [Aspergillus transmontanensis]
MHKIKWWKCQGGNPCDAHVVFQNSAPPLIPPNEEGTSCKKSYSRNASTTQAKESLESGRDWISSVIRFMTDGWCNRAAIDYKPRMTSIVLTSLLEGNGCGYELEGGRAMSGANSCKNFAPWFQGQASGLVRMAYGLVSGSTLYRSRSLLADSESHLLE